MTRCTFLKLWRIPLFKNFLYSLAAVRVHSTFISFWDISRWKEQLEQFLYQFPLLFTDGYIIQRNLVIFKHYRFLLQGSFIIFHVEEVNEHWGVNLLAGPA